MSSKEKNKLIVYTDGGARGNPGPAAIGVWVEGLNEKYSEFLGESTNNFAEYKAVIFALKKLKQLIGKEKAKKTSIEVRSDSELLVNQLNGKYKIKTKSIYPLFIEVWNLKQDFKSVEFVSVPREENKIADAIVNEELDAKVKKKSLF